MRIRGTGSIRAGVEKLGARRLAQSLHGRLVWRGHSCPRAASVWEVSVKKNGDPVGPGRIVCIARVAGAYRKLADAWIAQHTDRGLGHDFWMAPGVGDHFSIVVGGGEEVGVWTVLSCQRARGIVESCGLQLDELGKARLLPYFTDGAADQIYALFGGIGLDLVRKILDHIEFAFAPDGRDARDIEAAIEQVLAVRGRAHQRGVHVRSAQGI